jgi:hypothetical protein
MAEFDVERRARKAVEWIRQKDNILIYIWLLTKELIALTKRAKLPLYIPVSSGPAEYYCHYTVTMNIQAESSAGGK